MPHAERKEHKVCCESLKELLWTVGEGGCDRSNLCPHQLCQTANELHLPTPECRHLDTKVDAKIAAERENKDEGRI